MALAAWLSGEGFLGFILILYYKRLLFVKLALEYWSADLAHCAILASNQGVSMQRVIQDPIPLLILFGSILLTLWLWSRFRDR